VERDLKVAECQKTAKASCNRHKGLSSQNRKKRQVQEIQGHLGHYHLVSSGDDSFVLDKLSF
jgi:hypothetical protein